MAKTTKESSENNNITVSFVLNEKLLKALNAYTAKEDRSVSWVIRKALEQYLKIK